MMNLRGIILDQFESDIVTPLIEFGKSLSQIDADILIFMARKSLCLYDVLLSIGIPAVERCLVSDRVLDMQLDPLVGKRIALVDDTLILGTTLAKTKRRLETDAKAEVSVHVFCADKDWWCRDLIQPDSIALELDDRSLMTFCSDEVRALSLLPRPYLVDFPISQPIRFPASEAKCLLSSVEWTSHKISSELQERNEVSVFTFFPTTDILLELEDGLGSSIMSCLDITKVRGFIRRFRRVYSMQLVPIVTLRPLSSSDLGSLLTNLLDRIQTTSGMDLSRILYFADSLSAQQRLIQYFLSAALGERFMRTISASLNSSPEACYDNNETDRHYGPWLHSEMETVGKCVFPALWSSHGKADEADKIVVAPVNLPDSIREWSFESLSRVSSPVAKESRNGSSRNNDEIINLVADFAEIFLHLYDTREIPAREETQRLGLRVLDAKPQQAPNRDRLETGIPWQLLTEYLCQNYEIPESYETSNLFSLVLDLCNDLGIAVPITCVRNGIVFRAYRHGEDVRFSDGELALAYEAVRGFLQATERQTIPHLILEKLLVLLIKVGLARKFLEPLYGTSGVEGTVRIGFNLKGAVPILTVGPKDRTDRDIWLSKYLLKRKVLRQGPTRGYLLGETIQGNYRVPYAPDEAYELGNIIGMLTKSSTDQKRRNAPLDDKSITVLATCWPPRNAAAALQVELDHFQRWYEETGKSALKNMNWENLESINDCLKSLLIGKGHEAIHAARLKFVAYRTGQIEQIVEACRSFLEKNLEIDLPARKWESYWNAIGGLEVVNEKNTFDPWIDRAASLCWSIAACLSAIEISLNARCFVLSDVQNMKNLRQSFKKLEFYDKAMASTNLRQPTLAAGLVKRFQEVQSSEPISFDHEKALSYALNSIERLMPIIARNVEAMNPIIRQFGRFSNRHDYRYMLWYDIIDSTGTFAGRSGQDLETYRNQIKVFKQHINNQFHSISVSASKNACEVYCWNGDKLSSNDQKHVFFGGTSAIQYVRDVVEMLLMGAAACQGVRVRIYMIPCNFVGTTAYRQESDTEVSGERFWEHWSRLSKGCVALEAGHPRNASFLLIATEELIREFEVPNGVKWPEPKEELITSEIELLARNTLVRYGEVHLLEPS